MLHGERAFLKINHPTWPKVINFIVFWPDIKRCQRLSDPRQPKTVVLRKLKIIAGYFRIVAGLKTGAAQVIHFDKVVFF